MHGKCDKMNLKGGVRIIYRFSWFNKKTINPITDDNKCFQYHAKVALNHEEIRKKLQTKIIIKCNWKWINYPSGKVDWKGFETHNPCVYNTKKECISIYPAYIQNTTQIIRKTLFLIIPNGERWNCPAMKK